MTTIARPYLIPRKLIEISERTGVPVETLISLIALRFGPPEYRDDIRRELGMPERKTPDNTPDTTHRMIA